MPRVSVVIPTYNSANYLLRTLESVLNQTFKDFEIIVVDDGSTDNTKEVIRPYLDRIKYIHQSNSGGPSRPRNVGIKNADGTYISIFDSDDIMAPDKIKQAVTFLDSHPSLGMVFTKFIKCNEKGKRYSGTFLDGYDHFWSLEKRKVAERNFIISGKAAFEALFYENFIGTSGVVVPQSVFSTIGKFDESLTNGEDRDMWFRITNLYDIGYIDIIGHHYRIRKTSISNSGSALAENRIKAIRKQLEKELSSTTRSQAKRLIAENLFQIGYHHQAKGQMNTARKYYLKSLKESFNWFALRGVLITMLGSKQYFSLQKMKHGKTD